MSKSTCIIDFAGNARTCGMWCDYYPDEKVVTFGGYWCLVPDMPAEKEPTEEQCEQWAARFSKRTEVGFQHFLASA